MIELLKRRKGPRARLKESTAENANLRKPNEELEA
eukprot:CAMPEP_0197406054 /NCGR_PEP_ID=MMETSP1165-20131217/25273_1 /TAXON_ID=284809 /ORGANISM="Chrysocystis fragilis, Strain CCMP3189" /LENGTH=34 /DNA_ID= /DNA_START= /DNA_END= /DNA_ORIENTATION=